MTTLNTDHPIFDAVLEETGVDSRKTVFREKHADGADVQNRADHTEWLNDFTTRANRKVAEDGENLVKDLRADPLLGTSITAVAEASKTSKPTPAKAAKKAVPAQRKPQEETK